MQPIMSARTFTATVFRDGSTCFIPLAFDPRTVFGKVRAPVTVTLNGHSFRSTIAAMGGPPCIPLRKSHREAAGVEGGETLEVLVELDTQARVVAPPDDCRRALEASPSVWERWSGLSYTHQREHVESIEGARTPATRARRIARAVDAIRGT